MAREFTQSPDPQTRDAHRRALISGAGGLIGAALRERLAAAGWGVSRLVRRAATQPDEFAWNPQTGTIDAPRLEGFDAVIHLAGENIAGGRWTQARKARIRDSRVAGTRLLCDMLARAQRPPRVVVCASAIGFYGDGGDRPLDESSPRGAGFLADVCEAWEAAADPARRAGLRVVHPRIGIVLSGRGGALAKMLPPFRLGLGGPLGSGRQYMSWVALDDLTRAIEFMIENESLEGPVNAAAPEAATNAEYTRALGRALRRPTFLKVPSFVLRTLLGREMADQLLLQGQRVVPQKLMRSGFKFNHPQLANALAAALKKE